MLDRHSIAVQFIYLLFYFNLNVWFWNIHDLVESRVHIYILFLYDIIQPDTVMGVFPLFHQQRSEGDDVSGWTIGSSTVPSLQLESFGQRLQPHKRNLSSMWPRFTSVSCYMLSISVSAVHAPVPVLVLHTGDELLWLPTLQRCFWCQEKGERSLIKCKRNECIPPHWLIGFVPSSQDFKEQIIHHLATLVLLSFSWCVNYIRIGTLVMLVHDASDVLLEVSPTWSGWCSCLLTKSTYSSITSLFL